MWMIFKKCINIFIKYIHYTTFVVEFLVFDFNKIAHRVTENQSLVINIMYLLLVKCENWFTLQNISKIWTKCEKYIIFILNMPISIIKIEIHIHSKDLFSHSNKQIKLSKSSRYTGHGVLQLSSDSTDIKEESKLQMRKKWLEKN